jgi:predicted Zn-dependent protease
MVYKTLPGEELLVLFESLKNTGLNQQELALAASLKMQPVTPNQLKELHFRSVLHLLHINKLLEAKQLLADPSLSIDDSPDFENLKILLLLKENKLEEALTLARTLVSKYQQHSGGIARYLLNNCGVILLTQKNLSEARAAMAEITKLNSLYKPPFSQLINKK